MNDQIFDREYQAGRAALAEMRRLTYGYQLPVDACTSYRVAFDGLQRLEEDMHKHVHLENNILFPRVEKLIAG